MKTLQFILCGSMLAAAIVMQGCEVGPNYHTPSTPMPAAYSAIHPSTRPVAAVDVTQWWKALNDEELNSLVARAVLFNPNLQITLMHLQEARTFEYVANGAALPGMEASAGAARGSGTNSVKGRISGPLNAGTNTTGLSEITEVAGIDAAWNLDLFGGIRRQMEAARYDTQAAAAARDDAVVTLVAEVAAAYIDQRGVELRLQIARDDIKAEQQSYDLVQARFQRGFTNELDPALAARQLAEVEAEIAPLEAAQQADQRRLAVLMGQFPDALTNELNAAGALPLLPDRIEAGLPVELLRRRPDIREAERQLAAATARIGVATDALYPHVILTGGLGFQGQGLGRTPVENSFIGSIGPEAYWPLLDFGTLDALVQVQDYRTRELLLNYQQTILTAVEEVDNAIDEYSSQQVLLHNLDNALTAAKQAVQVVSQRYERGFTNYLDVLDAQRELYALQGQYAATQEQVVLEFISLYRALGGGWEKFQGVPPVRQPQPAIIAAIQRGIAPGDPQKPTPETGP
jgi:NodT family efflux transporter outer membrane factor (OMF) lipoprotein